MPTTNLGRIKPIHKGEYSASTLYSPLDIVVHNGLSYFCIQDSTGNSPAASSQYFSLIAPAGTNGTNGTDGVDGVLVTGTMVLARSSQSLTGFLECDGSTYDETVYTGLVAAGHVEAAVSLTAIDLGADGKLILPVQVGSDVYYYWDLNGDDTPSDTEALVTTQNRFMGSGVNFNTSEPQITVNGVNIVLPELGASSPTAGGLLAKGGSYTGLAALWDAHTDASGLGSVAGWPATVFCSSTPFNTSGAWRLGFSSSASLRGRTTGTTSSSQNSGIAVRVTNPPTGGYSYVLPDSADFNLPTGYSYYVKY